MSKIDKNGNIEISTPNIHLKDGVKNGTIRETKDYKSKSTGSISIFGLIFVIIFVIAFVNYLRTGQISNVTFKGFIEFLANAPQIDVSWSLVDLTIYGDWGAFNFLRIFFNWFTDMFEVMISFFGMIIQSLGYIFYFVKGLLFGI